MHGKSEMTQQSSQHNNCSWNQVHMPMACILNHLHPHPPSPSWCHAHVPGHRRWGPAGDGSRRCIAMHVAPGRNRGSSRQAGTTPHSCACSNSAATETALPAEPKAADMRCNCKASASLMHRQRKLVLQQAATRFTALNLRLQ